MKRLFLILILTFIFQSLSKADDIRDFEIEGMSIGDSLLDHFDKKDLNRFIKDGYFYKDNKFSRTEYEKYLLKNQIGSYSFETSFKKRQWKS